MTRCVIDRLIVAVFFSLLSGLAGAESFCDPNLVDRSDSSLAYREREGRCEGIYGQQVSAVSIDVRSLVAVFAPFDPARDTELVLAWTAPPGTELNVRVRAFSLQPRKYFRMDTAVPASRGAYRWPTDVLSRLGLGQEALGVIAWMALPGPGGTTREVYLPLRAGSGAAAPEEGYQVALVPSKRLREVHVSVSRLDDRGGVAADLRRGEELGYGYYPSNEPTVFSTGRLGSAGFYLVEIAATPVEGTPVKQGFELYHSGDSKGD
ncbi:MAG TPA: hypothetical protein VEL74_11480 [Thermoanaerobaculia bacterium]|nr:hypothetical protein [Thermoanaerobaculia bacterium]